VSLEHLTKPKLLTLAENFGVDIDENASKLEMVAELAENGVTWEMAKQFDEEVAAKDAEIRADAEAEEVRNREESDKHLLLMTRANRSFEIRGYRFTADHPFALVDEENAAWIAENIEGFRYATPREVQEYYA
jgi:hypothetical protein